MLYSYCTSDIKISQAIRLHFIIQVCRQPLPSGIKPVQSISRSITLSHYPGLFLLSVFLILPLYLSLYLLICLRYSFIFVLFFMSRLFLCFLSPNLSTVSLFKLAFSFSFHVPFRRILYRFCFLTLILTLSCSLSPLSTLHFLPRFLPLRSWTYTLSFTFHPLLSHLSFAFFLQNISGA